MFITIIDIIEEKILDHFDCPTEADPKRIKLFWKYIGCVVLLAAVFAFIISIFIREPWQQAIVGIFFMGSGIIITKLYKPDQQTKQKVQEWWQGKGKWYYIFK
jgi:hypothetical protein